MLAPILLLAARIALPVGFKPTALASADFNGDGNADIAVAGLGAERVVVLFGDGHGGFRVGPSIPCGATPSSVTATNAYIAVANHETDYVTLLSGDGKGHFTSQTLHLHSRPHPHEIGRASCRE